MNIIQNLPPKLDKTAWVGVDLEVFDLNDKQLHRPTSGRFALLTIAHNDDVYVLDDEKQVAPALENIQDAWWIIQNAKFDIAHLRRWADIPPRNKIWDTMLVDRILWGGYYDTFSLDDLTRRYLYEHLDKSYQTSFTGHDISTEQLAYAAKDSWVLPKIVQEQKREMTNKTFATWHNFDRPALFAFLDFPGFAIDVEKWEQLAIRNRAYSDQVDMHLPINPRSPKQVKEYLWEHGYKVKSTAEGVLSDMEIEDDEVRGVVNGVLESRKYRKLSSTYGMNFIEDYLEEDGGVPVIVADYWVTGAKTGRTSSSSPNMQNIPARGTTEYRECFIARPGNKIVVVDYSQQEVVICAYISKDERLVEVCNSGADIYIMMAKIMYDMDIDKSHPLRSRMKSVVLGMNYGMSTRGLAIREGISIDEAEDVFYRLHKNFPTLNRWMEAQKAKKGYVETISGRRSYLNPYNSQSERNALNSPIQGSAGDAMKYALANIHREWDSRFGRFGVVGYIHDELVLDVPEHVADDVAQFTSEVMVYSAEELFPGMNFRAEAVVGDTWAVKH